MAKGGRRFEVTLEELGQFAAAIQSEPLGNVTQQKLDAVLSRIGVLETQGQHLMVTLADIKAQSDALVANIAAESTVDDSIIELLNGIAATNAALKQQLADAIASGDPAALQAVLDALTAANAATDANKAKIVAAVTANTPAA